MEEEKNIEVAEGDNDKLCATSRKDSNSRCSSASKSLKSGKESINSDSIGSKNKGTRRGPIMPEPLPLYDGEAIDEPAGTGIRRPTKLLSNQPGGIYGIGYCPHEEVYDWVCKECKKRVSQFDSVFDDYQGRVTKYLKVCYENQFLQDFLTEQINQLEMVATKQISDDSNDSSEYEGEIQEEVGELPSNKNKREEKRNPDIIWQCYQPINTTELREYMLFCMSNDLQASIMMKKQEEDNLKGEEILNNNRDGRHETATENSHTFENERNDTESADQVRIDESIPVTTSIDKGGGIDVIKEEPHQLTVEEKLKLLKNSHWVPYQLTHRLGTGKIQNLSMRLTRFLNEYEERNEQLMKKYNGDVILFDTIFESGNLLRADRITRGEYRLYMQVDTNTKGHQQWFYFRVRNTRKDRKFVFKIMNFTKPGVTGSSGIRKNELFQRIMYKSKLSGQEEWSSIGPDKLEFVKTKVQRRKKDVLAAGADSDQEDWVEEAFGLDPDLAKGLHVPNNDEETDYNRMTSNTEVPSPLVNMRSGLSKDIVNSIKKKRKFFYYSLVFEVRFDHDDDTVFFAFSQPYTYSQTMSEVIEKEELLKPDAPTDVQTVPRKVIGQNLNPPPKPENPPLERQNTNPQANHQITKQSTLQNLNQAPQLNHQSTLQTQKVAKDKQTQQNDAQPAPPKIEKKPTPGIQFENQNKCIYYQRRELCRSVCGIPLWQITISRHKQGLMRKPTIVITSRVHSGETPASIVFQGIFDFLTSDRKEAKFLRKFYTFVLIPVLNPDGVICGNYRNSITGLDLNRQWINPDQEFQPEVFYTKQMFKTFTDLERRQIWIYCDIHGHSKKKNSFFYGCNTAANGGFLSWTIVRILPRIFAQKTHLFNYRDCRFKVEPYKIGTGRVVAWKQFQITHSFTLENSFYGYDFGEEESKEFSEEEYQGVGSKFIESIYELHFIWKQIKRELQITNGWLKPKVLFEKTGMPAAQLLNEEIEKKKKDEKKKQAIEQYQQFLKKYYNQGRGAVINPLPQSQLVVKTKNEKGPVTQAQPPSTGSSQSSMSQNNFAFGSKNNRGPRNQSDDTETTKSRNPNSKIISTSESNQRLANFSTKTENIRPNSSQHQMKNQAKLAQADNLNADLEFQDEDELQEDIMKSLFGLVKVQARIRGIITRRRVKKLMDERKKDGGNKIPKDFKFINHGLDLQSIQKHTTSNSVLQSISQRSNKLIRSSSFHEKHRKQTNSDHSVDGDSYDNKKKRMHSSKDTLSRGSNLEHLSTRRQELINRDWRHYFQETELDNAFQKVEIECRDISEEGSSAASTSNPSDDNLEPEEIYKKVYSISPEKANKIVEKKKEQTKKLIQQMTNPEAVTGPQLFDKIQGKGDSDTKAGNGRAIQSGNPSRRGTLKFYRAFNQKTNSSVAMQNMQNIGVLGQNIPGLSAQDRTMDNDLNMNHNKQASPYFQLSDANNSSLAGGLNSQQINQRASNTHSPLNALDQYAVNDYNLSSANIAFQQVHGRGLMLSKEQLARQRINQQRATTSHGSGMGSSMMNQSLMSHGFQPNHQQSTHPTNISQQMRHMHLNYKGGYGKKENINQVIKDCFITKKCEVRKPQAQSQANGPQSKSVNSGYHGTFKNNSNSNTKKGRKIKRVKSPMNAMEHPNQFYRSVGAMNNHQNQTGKQQSQKAMQRNYYGAAAMLKDIKDRNSNFVYVDKNSLDSNLHLHNMTQNIRNGPNINNMYALEDLDERDPAGLRAMKINQSAQPHDSNQQAFFERTQQPGVRSSSNQGPQANKIQMNANPAYYQVMYNEMVQKTNNNLNHTASGNIYGSDSKQFQINANMMRSRKALGKTNTQSISGSNQIMNFRMHQQQHHQQKREQQEFYQNQATVFNDFIQDQNLFEAVPDSALMNVNKTQMAIPHTYPVSLKKYGSTGDQDDFSLRDQNLDNTNMFIDKAGRQMRLPDISHLSASSDMPETFQAQLQNFQLDPYALHQRQPQQSVQQMSNPAHIELGLTKAQYYSQNIQKNSQMNQARDKNSNLAIRTNESNANLVDDAEIIKYQNQTSPKIKNSGPSQINLQSNQLNRAFSHRKQPFIQRAHATPVMNDRQPVHQPGSGARQMTSHGNMLHNSLDNKQVNMIHNGANMAPQAVKSNQIPLSGSNQLKPRGTPGLAGSHKATLIQNQQTVHTGPAQVGNGLGDPNIVNSNNFAQHQQPKIGAGHSAKVAQISRDSPGMMSNQVQNLKATHSQNRVHSQRLGENPIYDQATVSNLKIEGQHGASQKRYVRKYITKHE